MTAIEDEVFDVAPDVGVSEVVLVVQEAFEESAFFVIVGDGQLQRCELGQGAFNGHIRDGGNSDFLISSLIGVYELHALGQADQSFTLKLEEHGTTCHISGVVLMVIPLPKVT